MLNSIINRYRAFQCEKNYQKKLESLKNKDKIRVIFLVSENQKWGYQSLYEELEASERFEPLVLISLLEGVHKGKDKTRRNLEENYNFFKSRGMKVDYAYKDGKYVDLRKFSPDIVFYEQPWGLPKQYKPFYVSAFALTAYRNYGLAIFYDDDNYNPNFHRQLYKYFVDNKLNVKRYESYNTGNSKNCVIIGDSKLDTYFIKENKNIKKIWKDSQKNKVIYAAHHSIGKNSSKLSTFLYHGEFILKLARKYSDTTWIFMPHPQLKYALINNEIMTEDEIDKYYQSWEDAGYVYTQGDYFDIFKTSDLMITDCCSFLGEYLPTGKPIIHLINPNHIEYNEFGTKIISQDYEAYNCAEIEKIFNELVVNKNDYLKEERMKLIPELIDFSEPSAKKIMRYLKGVLKSCER